MYEEIVISVDLKGWGVGSGNETNYSFIPSRMSKCKFMPVQSIIY